MRCLARSCPRCRYRRGMARRAPTLRYNSKDECETAAVIGKKRGIVKPMVVTRLYQAITHGLAAVVIAGLTGLFLNHTVNFALDDSYITYRYAQHLELGYGPVFNVGEPYLG